MLSQRQCRGFSVAGLDLSVRLRFTDSAGSHRSRKDARPVRELKHHDIGWPMDPGLHTPVN